MEERKAHQRLIRERRALEGKNDPLLEEKLRLASDLKRNGFIREIDRKTAEQFIIHHEWLGNVGSTENAVGLFVKNPVTGEEYLGGVECFGRTNGTHTSKSVCGREYAHLVTVLIRGACEFWTDPPRTSSDGRVHTGSSASFTISHACRLMTQKGFHIFVAYADDLANELGCVYQSAGWIYCGPGSTDSSMFVWPGEPVTNPNPSRILDKIKDGRPRDEHAIRNLTRCRKQESGPYRVRCSSRELKRMMIEEGFTFYTAPPKHRYVGFYGDSETVNTLKAALRWKVLPYPKRERHQTTEFGMAAD